MRAQLRRHGERCAFFYARRGLPDAGQMGDLLETLLDAGHRVLAPFASDAAAEINSKRLWLARFDSFVPHGLATAPHPEMQPVLFSGDLRNLNRATALVLFGGGRLGPWAAGYETVCCFVDAADPTALREARANWHAAKEAGFARRFFEETTVDPLTRTRRAYGWYRKV